MTDRTSDSMRDGIKVDVDHHFHAIGAVFLAAFNARPAALQAADTQDADETIVGVDGGESFGRPVGQVIDSRVGKTIDHVETVMKDGVIGRNRLGAHVGENFMQRGQLRGDEISLQPVDVGGDARINEKEAAALDVFVQVFPTVLIDVAETFAEKEGIGAHLGEIIDVGGVPGRVDIQRGGIVDVLEQEMIALGVTIPTPAGRLQPGPLDFATPAHLRFRCTGQNRRQEKKHGQEESSQ